MPLKPQEEAVLALRDRGRGVRDIAAELQMPLHRVATIVGQFGDIEARDRSYARAMRNNSATFLARLQAEGMVIHG